MLWKWNPKAFSDTLSLTHDSPARRVKEGMFSSLDIWGNWSGTFNNSSGAGRRIKDRKSQLWGEVITDVKAHSPIDSPEKCRAQSEHRQRSRGNMRKSSDKLIKGLNSKQLLTLNFSPSSVLNIWLQGLLPLGESLEKWYKNKVNNFSLKAS